MNFPETTSVSSEHGLAEIFQHISSHDWKTGE